MQYQAEIQGKSGRWSVVVPSKAQADAMRADGIEVVQVVNTIPAWVADMGLGHVWCAIEDIWSLPSRWFSR